MQLVNVVHETVISLPWFTLAVVPLISYVLIRTIYDLYFSPLANYPGPFFARISVWPSFWHTLRKDRHVWIWKCHQLYGPVFRYRPDGLMFNTPSAYQSIYNSKANVHKGSSYVVGRRYINESQTWSEIDKLEHAGKRRVLNHAFSEKALRSSEKFIIQNVDRWCEILLDTDGASEGWSKPRDMAHFCDYLVLDIFGDLCFGKSFDSKEAGHEDLKAVPHAISNWVYLNQCVSHSPFTTFYLWLKPRGLDKLVTEYLMPKNIVAYFNFVGGCLAERMKQEPPLEEHKEKGLITSQGKPEPQQRKDMLHYILNVQVDTGEKGYSPAELYGEVNSLVVGGADTTSTAIASSLFYITTNARVLSKLAAELLTTFSSAEEISQGRKLTGCKYLRAVIDESIRLSPPVISDLMRVVTPGTELRVDIEPTHQSDNNVGGVAVIPAGTIVTSGIYAVCLNEDIYAPDPYVFRPERWIENRESLDRSFYPFSTGVRGCPGKNLAYLQLQIAIGRLVYRAEMKNCGGEVIKNDGAPGGDKVYHVKDAFMAVKKGPVVQFRPRSAKS